MASAAPAAFASAEPSAALVAAAAAVPAEALNAAATQTFSKVVMNTLSDCQLAVSSYPTFSYDAAGGGGTATVTSQGTDGLLHLEFDTASLNIPPINYLHAKVLGVPIPPPMNIEIVPKRLEGTLDPATGQLDLEFLASFEFTAGPLYRAAPLTVSTTLTTETSDGVRLHGKGERLRADGRARLVGVASVPKTNDFVVDGFLSLPNDALAVLSAELRFS